MPQGLVLPRRVPIGTTPTSVVRALDHAAAQRAKVDAEPGASEGEASSAAARQAPHPLPRVPRASWAWLDTVELAAEFASPAPTLQGVPGFMLPGARRAWAFALRALCTDDPRTGATQVRAWKLSCCCPGCCSHAAPLGAQKARRNSCSASRTPRRLLGGAAGPSARPSTWRASELPTSAQLRARACAQARQGELSRARRTLTSASLAPGDEATLAALSGPPLPPPPSLPAAAIRLDAAAVAESCWPMRPRLRCLPRRQRS